MAERTVERPPARAQGLMGNVLAFPLRLFGMLCGSLLLSIIVECIGMQCLWPQQSWHHAEEMLEHEISQLSESFRRSLLLQQPERLAQEVVSWTREHLFVKTGLLDDVHRLSERQEAQVRHTSALPRLLGLSISGMEDYLHAAGLTLLVFLVRLLVLILTLPLFGLAWFVGLVDGLARRDVRRFGAGRESGFVYHRARALLLPLVVFPWVVYLALPVSVAPLWVFLPSAVLLSVGVNVMAGSFKKYL